jgi:hypothetical protein
MKKYKQFGIGLIVGAILFSSIGVFAEGLTVLLNQFPIVINGQQAEVEAYNINGRTFLALGDVAKYFDATAVFNETTKRIDINSATTTTENLPFVKRITHIPMDTELKQPIGAEFVDFKGLQAIKYNNKTYIYQHDLNKLGIRLEEVMKFDKKSIYSKNNKKVTIDFNNLSDFVEFGGFVFIDKDLFNELIGE